MKYLLAIKIGPANQNQIMEFNSNGDRLLAIADLEEKFPDAEFATTEIEDEVE